MTKQEWVQKYFEDILNSAWRKGIEGKGIDLTEEATTARLHLAKWGVVIKSAGQKVPMTFGGLLKDNKDIFRVEPLIKEE